MNPPPTLLTLPRELRDLIYTYVLAPDSPSTNFSSKAEDNADHPRPSLTATTLPSLLPHLPALTKVSQQLHHETTPLFLRQSTLIFRDAASTLFLADWIDGFGAEAWSAIRYLDIMDFTPTAAPLYHALLSKCTNLLVLRIIIHVPGPRLVGPPAPQKIPASAFRDEKYMQKREKQERRREESKRRRFRNLVAMHQLDKLLDLESLKELTVRVLEEARLIELDMISYALKAWIVNGWRARGRGEGVNVTVGWEDWDAYVSDDEDMCGIVLCD